MNVLLSGVVGSVAYGLNHEGSDVDRLGIFAAPTTAFHGLHLPNASHVNTKPDVTLHEAGKAARLLLQCNPTMTEILWLPDGLYDVVSPLGDQLLDIRTAFLSARRVRGAYFGYARDQFSRLLKRNDGSFSADTRKRSLKHARHLVRLVEQGRDLYNTGRLSVHLDQPERIVKRAEIIVEMPDIGLQFIHNEESRLAEKSALPERPDEMLVERWLQRVRHHFYDQRSLA